MTVTFGDQGLYPWTPPEPEAPELDCGFQGIIPWWGAGPKHLVAEGTTTS